MTIFRRDFPAWAFLPGLLLLAGMAALFWGLPYAMLDGDGAVFGVMGNDLLTRGYWPTLVYGQNYLLSPTPYAYALGRLLAPSFPPALALAVAGSLFSLGGMGLILAALCRAQRRAGGGQFWPVLAAVLLMAGNVVFVTDHARNSGVELSLFIIGLLLWAGSRLESRSRPADWALLGAAAGVALISRLQMVFYALPLLGLLLLRLFLKKGLRPAAAAAGWAAAGALAGYAPMLAHRLGRGADWPFPFELPLTLGTGDEIARSWRLTVESILPSLFGVRSEMAWKPLRYVAWAVAVLPAYGWTCWKRPAKTSMLDHALVLGSLAVLSALVLVPSLSRDGEQRRYALTVFVAGVWLCARFWPAPGWRNAAVTALAAGLLAASVPRWCGRLERSIQTDRQLRETRARLVPELEAQKAAILANYWDASLLQFLADGRLAVESFPWGVVRTYGWVTPEAFRRRTLWLAVQGRERELAGYLRVEAGEEAFAGRTRIPLRNRFQGKAVEAWEFQDQELGLRLMERLHPLYFRTQYPPGS
jgi:hypothetical protein